MFTQCIQITMTKAKKTEKMNPSYKLYYYSNTEMWNGFKIFSAYETPTFLFNIQIHQ